MQTKTKLSKSYLLHEDDNIFIVATSQTSNVKTGDMIQIWILDNTRHPVESRRDKHDATNQCKGCPLASGNGCYVNTNPLATIYRKHKSDSPYPHLTNGSTEFRKFFSGKKVRFGAYGNPSLIPLLLTQSIAILASKWTGYFHDWHLMTPDDARAYGKYFMASCESTNYHEAQALGLRTFTTVVDAPSDKRTGMECLADSHGMQCAECGLCDGTNRRGGKLPNVWIKVHGYQTKKASVATIAPAN